VRKALHPVIESTTSHSHLGLQFPQFFNLLVLRDLLVPVADCSHRQRPNNKNGSEDSNSLSTSTPPVFSEI